MQQEDNSETKPNPAQPLGGSNPGSGSPDEHAATQPQPAAPVEPDLSATLATPVSRASDDEELSATQVTPAKAFEKQPAMNKPAYEQPPVTAVVQPPAKQPPARRSVWGWVWPVLAVIVLILIGAGSAYAGYNSAIAERLAVQETSVATSLGQQYQLGMEDLLAGRFEIARQRFAYILDNAPDYPGATEGLAQALLGLNATATPTIQPTPTVTPTVDNRGVDLLFSQAQSALSARDWTLAIDTLLALRKADPAFQSVRVDGMLYIALRNRGVEKILNNGDLEGGTYDLALAERFGPLDAEARNYRIWVNLYMTGSSFWEVDWSQSVFYFSQLANAVPGLRDAAGLTAYERYRLALLGYGDTFAAAGEWCSAYEQYNLALSLGNSVNVEPTAVYAAEQCNTGGDGGNGGEGGGEQPPIEGQPTLTPTPPAEATPTPPTPYP